MAITLGVSVLIGTAIGLHFNVFVLIAAVVLALVSTAAIGMAHGDQMWPVVLTMVVVGTAFQISYLAGAVIREAGVGFVGPGRTLAEAQYFGYSADDSKMTDIHAHMEVVGSDGNHVGAVDHRERNRIILTGDDPKAGGKPHLISVDWVDYVDSKIHLNKPSEKALSEWQVAA
jgi:hypothetical protein